MLTKYIYCLLGIIALFIVFAIPVEAQHQFSCTNKTAQEHKEPINRELYAIFQTYHLLVQDAGKAADPEKKHERQKQFRDLLTQLDNVRIRVEQSSRSDSKLLISKILYLKNKISKILEAANSDRQENMSSSQDMIRSRTRNDKAKFDAEATAIKRSQQNLAPPGNDNCINATVITSGSYFGDTTEATNDGSSSCNYELSPDVWFKYHATTNGIIMGNTYGSDFYTVLSVHTGCPGTSGNEVTCHNEYCNGFGSCISFYGTAGTDYYVRVSGYYYEDYGSYQLNIGTPGSISGTVTDSITNAPIPNVKVEIFNTNDYLEYSTTSDLIGNYITEGLAPGTYYVMTSTNLNYIDELYDNIPCENSNCTPSIGTPIQVISGQTTADINFALDPGGRIQGRVTDSTTGNPIPNIGIRIYNSAGTSVTSMQSDAIGYYFTTKPLSSGTYYAASDTNQNYIDELYNNIFCEPYCNPLSGTPIPVTIGQTASNIDFILDPGGKISGTVIDSATAAPIGSVEINVYNSFGNYVTDAYTYYTGNYITDDPLITGNYFVTTDSNDNYIDELYDNYFCEPYCNPLGGTPVPVTVTQTKENINFALDRGGSISGTVTDALLGTPIDYGWIDIYDIFGNYVSDAYINSSGFYTTSNGPLLTGNYYVVTDMSSSTCYQNELYDNFLCEPSCTPTTGTPVHVMTGSNTPHIDFGLDAALNLESHKPGIDDSQSTYPNHVIEPDETVNIVSTIKNLCSTSANSVQGHLVTSDPIQIIQAIASFPVIGGYDELTCGSCYAISAPANNRPSLHWDVTVTETLSCPQCTPSSASHFILHIGGSFADVVPMQIFYPYIETLLHNNITSGCTATTYCPSELVERQQMAKFICRSMNAYESNSCNTSSCTGLFNDVPASNPFCPDIETLYDEGITNGCQSSPALFCPDTPTQRQAMAKFICNALDYVYYCNPSNCDGVFDDVDSSNPFCGYIEALYYDNIISGCTANNFCPSNNVTREQMAKFLVNAFKLEL